jgi:hypothetical protein
VQGGRIKGSVILSRLAFLKEKKGDDALSRVIARLPADDQKTLAAVVLPFTWYPFEISARLDLAIAEEMGQGDTLFRMLGQASARDNLTSTQKHYVADRNPHALLKQASAIYGVYYDTGHRTYERVSDSKAILRTHDAQSFSREDCLTVIGWHEQAIEMCGGRNPRVVETRCRARGDSVCEYVCEWTLGTSVVPPRPSSKPPAAS